MKTSQPSVKATTYPEQGEGSDVASNGGLMAVTVRLEGITPLLQNAMTEQELLAIRNKKKAPKNASRPSTRDEAAQGLHVLPDGRPHIPLSMLWSCLVGAGQYVRLDGKRQISTAKSTNLAGLMTIMSTVLPIVDPRSSETARWEVDIQQGRNPNGGEAVAIVRPRFDHWALEIEITVDQNEVSIDKIRELFDIAGRRRGLGDFRPACKGIFGQFKVTAWRLSEAVAAS